MLWRTAFAIFFSIFEISSSSFKHFSNSFKRSKTESSSKIFCLTSLRTRIAESKTSTYSSGSVMRSAFCMSSLDVFASAPSASAASAFAVRKYASVKTSSP